MPLTDEERQEILARRQTRQTMQMPGTLPPSVAETAGTQPYVSGVTIPKTGIRLNFPKPTSVMQQEVEQERQKRLMQAQTPILTETERERTPMAQTSVKFLDQFANNLGLKTEDGKPIIKYPEKVAPSFARELVPQKLQDYILPEESSIIYNDLESAFQLGSIVLTGRQGDLQKLQQIRDVYSFGGAIKNKPKLAMHRYQNLRRLFQTFDKVQTLPPAEKQQVLNQASQQMDKMLKEPTQIDGLSPEAQSLINRYRKQ